MPTSKNFETPVLAYSIYMKIKSIIIIFNNALKKKRRKQQLRIFTPFNAPQTAKSASVTECPTRNATGARLLFKDSRALLCVFWFSTDFILNSSQWSTYR